MNIFRAVKWKWYHFIVFCLPGGMFLVGVLIACQIKNNNKGALQ